MNFSSKVYMTENLSEEIIVGNFIGDSVKGKAAYENYPEKVRTGIDIHREIDYYSDIHPAFKKGVKRLYPNYGKYASIIMDIYYDHILASNWEKYH